MFHPLPDGLETMKYDLAKKLKDAGFKPISFGVGTDLSTGQEFPFNERYPSLSELIDACGGRMDELSNTKHGERKIWRSCAYPCEECGYLGLYVAEGETPEEAVANLWLELNKKQ